jgi:hypothetical protein
MLATTTLDASVTLPSLNNKQVDIHIVKGQNIKDLVHHLLESHALPPYYSNSLYSAINSAMTETCQKELLHQHKNHQPDKKALRHLFLEAYQLNTLQYNNKPEEVSILVLYFYLHKN